MIGYLSFITIPPASGGFFFTLSEKKTMAKWEKYRRLNFAALQLQICHTLMGLLIH